MCNLAKIHSTKEATSPTTALEAIFTTIVIGVKHKRDVMTLYIPNLFVRIDISLGRDKIIMNIRGQLVKILIEIYPEVYKKYVRYEGKQKFIYIHILKALYIILVSLILYYKKFIKDIKFIGFEVNRYNICVANQMKSGKQKTFTWCRTH